MVAASASITSRMAVATPTARPVEGRRRGWCFGAGIHWGGGHGGGACSMGPEVGAHPLVWACGESGTWLHGSPASGANGPDCIDPS